MTIINHIGTLCEQKAQHTTSGSARRKNPFSDNSRGLMWGTNVGHPEKDLRRSASEKYRLFFNDFDEYGEKRWCPLMVKDKKILTRITASLFPSGMQDNEFFWVLVHRNVFPLHCKDDRSISDKVVNLHRAAAISVVYSKFWLNVASSNAVKTILVRIPSRSR